MNPIPSVRSAVLLAVSLTVLVGAVILADRGGASLPPPPIVAAAPAAATAAAGAPTAAERADRVAAPTPALAIADVFHGAAIGTRMVFAVRVDQASTLTLGDIEPTQFALHVEGEQELIVLDRREDELLVSVAFPQLRLRTTAAGAPAPHDPDADMVQALATPSTMHLRSDGSEIGWRAADGCDPAASHLARSLLAQQRFVVVGNAAHWHVTESDVDGEHEVDYRRLPDRDGRLVVGRNRRSLAPAVAGDAVVHAEVVDDSTAEFDPELGWLVASQCRVGVTHRFGEDCTVVTRGDLSLQLLRVDQVVVDEADWGGTWISGPASACELPDDRDGRTQDEALVAGGSVEELMAAMRAAVATSGPGGDDARAVHERLKASLRLDPAGLRTVEAMLGDGTLDDAASGNALGAVGSVGTEAAQDLLTRFARDAGRRPAQRAAAIISLFQVAEPTAATRAAVEAQFHDLAEPLPLRRGALLLLGSQARDDAARQQRLLTLAPIDNGDGMLETFVEALANARMRETIAGYRSHSDNEVRRAADRAWARGEN
ncbi:MAG: hypothetical protein AB7O97_03780 [Planctomycetota bacterium]